MYKKQIKKWGRRKYMPRADKQEALSFPEVRSRLSPREEEKVRRFERDGGNAQRQAATIFGAGAAAESITDNFVYPAAVDMS